MWPAVSHHDPPVSAQHGLPREILPEVLGEIFGWVIAHIPLDKEGRDGIVDLMLVCRLWHDVVRQTHHLWGRVSLPVTKRIDYDKLVEWFNNAGTTDKTLRLTNRNFFEFCPCGRLGHGAFYCYLQRSDLARFLAAGPPLDHLILPTCPSSCFEYLIYNLGLIATERSSLSWHSIRCLTLSFGRGYHVEPTRTSGPIFHSLPLALTSLNLRFTSSDSQMPSRFAIPPSTLERLKSLKIDCHWHITRVADLLHHCTSLEHLGISHCSAPRQFMPIRSVPGPSKGETDSLSHVSPISLPHLLSLSLDIYQQDDSAYILHRLTTPSVIGIRIHNDGSGQDQRVLWDSLNALDVLMQGPGHPNIQSLTIYECYASTPSVIPTSLLIDLLTNLPRLTHLCLERVTFDAQELLATLQRGHPRGQAVVAPQLRTIELVEPGDNFRLEDLLHYVMLRPSRERPKRLELKLRGNRNYRRLCILYEHSPIVKELRSAGTILDLYR